MRIKTVKWEELRSGPGYENQRAGVEIELGNGDDPAEAMVEAKKFVTRALSEKLGLSCATESELNHIRDLANRLHTAVNDASIPF